MEVFITKLGQYLPRIYGRSPIDTAVIKACSVDDFDFATQVLQYVDDMPFVINSIAMKCKRRALMFLLDILRGHMPAETVNTVIMDVLNMTVCQLERPEEISILLANTVGHIDLDRPIADAFDHGCVDNAKILLLHTGSSPDMLKDPGFISLHELNLSRYTENALSMGIPKEDILQTAMTADLSEVVLGLINQKQYTPLELLDVVDNTANPQISELVHRKVRIDADSPVFIGTGEMLKGVLRRRARARAHARAVARGDFDSDSDDAGALETKDAPATPAHDSDEGADLPHDYFTGGCEQLGEPAPDVFSLFNNTSDEDG